MEAPGHYFLAGGAAFIASCISGTAGFGGAMLLLPALALLYGIEIALPLLAAAQLTGNAARAFWGFKELQWQAIGYFAAGAVPAGIVAAAGLMVLPLGLVRTIVAVIICAVALLEVAVVFSRLPRSLQHLKPPEQAGFWLTAAGFLVGLASGVAGTTGPLSNAFFLRLNLLPASYVATEAAAMCLLHAGKLIAFGSGDWLKNSDPLLCVIICAAMVGGTWLGKHMLGRVTVGSYRRAVAIWMLVSAAAMFLVPVE